MKISDIDIRNIKMIVTNSIISTEQHIRAFIPNCQRWLYGRELRMRIISELADHYPDSMPYSKQSYKIILPNSFSFFVTAEQDYHRTANYKILPDLFDIPAYEEEKLEDGDYELVLGYDAPFFNYASLIPHKIGFPIISILEGRSAMASIDATEYNETARTDFEIQEDIIPKTGTSNE